MFGLNVLVMWVFHVNECPKLGKELNWEISMYVLPFLYAVGFGVCIFKTDGIYIESWYYAQTVVDLVSVCGYASYSVSRLRRVQAEAVVEKAKAEADEDN